MKKIINNEFRIALNKKQIVNIIVCVLLFGSTMVSCRNLVIRDLTGKVVLDEIKEYSDTVDFYVRHIDLVNAEQLDTTYWRDYIGINLFVVITNKLDENIILAPHGKYNFFIGVYSSEGRQDTLAIGANYPMIMGPRSSIDIWTSISDVNLLLEKRLDNTLSMLNIVKQTKFYYDPCLEGITLEEGAIVIDRPYRLRTDANTKITSWNNLKRNEEYCPSYIMRDSDPFHIIDQPNDSTYWDFEL